MQRKGLDTDERRRHQRLPHLFGATLFRPGEEVPLFVVDLSAGGVHAAAHARVELNSRWTIRLESENATSRLEAEVQVVWLRETALSGSFHFGLEFLQDQVGVGAHRLLAELDSTPLGLGEAPSFRGLSGDDIDRLSTLGKISRILNRTRAVDNLLHQLTRLLKDSFVTERAMVLIRHEQELRVVSLDGSAEGCEEALFSRKVTRKVLDQGDALLSLDAREDRNLGPSQSIDLMGTRAIMCVPLRDDEMVFGLLYLDNAYVAAAFSKADLEMVSIIADIASAAIERAEIGEILRQNEAELTVAKRAAEAADLAKTNFLASVSHEIRTPMNGVLGMTRQLMSTPLSPDQEHCLSIVHQSAQGLLEIINDLLDYSRMGASELELQFTSFSLCEVVEECLHTVQAPGLQVSHTLDKDLPDTVIGDSVRLLQVLTRLLGNAVKFTSPGGRIELAVRPEDERVRFELKDTGVGISGEKLSLVFEPFTQADSSTTRRYGGMGMGLALCQGLIRLMGGELTVHSREGQGSVFAFAIPLPAAQEKAPPSRLYAAADIPSLSVLVVEDNLINQVVAEGLLLEWGHEVQVADNGQIAVDMLGPNHTFDLVFMDLQMPVLDGIQATIKIRRNEKTQGRRRVPIVALTAHGTSQDKESCRQAGMDGFLNKPVVAEDFLQCLGSLFASDPAGT